MFPFFFFNDTATTEIYTLSLHDALPILAVGINAVEQARSIPRTKSFHAITEGFALFGDHLNYALLDRKSTRLNSSHLVISYAVFCLKKKTTESLALVVPRRHPCSARLSS